MYPKARLPGVGRGLDSRKGSVSKKRRKRSLSKSAVSKKSYKSDVFSDRGSLTSVNSKISKKSTGSVRSRSIRSKKKKTPLKKNHRISTPKRKIGNRSRSNSRDRTLPRKRKSISNLDLSSSSIKRYSILLQKKIILFFYNYITY